MEKFRTSPRPFLRALVAAVAACLLFLQGLGGLAASHAHQSPAGATLTLAPCHVVTQDLAKGQAPAAPRHEHSECCLSCEASDRSLLLAVALLSGVAALLAPAGEATALTPPQSEVRSPPIGWASSWSSRAPPRRFA